MEGRTVGGLGNPRYGRLGSLRYLGCASAALRDRDASRAWKPGTAINLGPIHPGSSQAQAMSITFESFPAPGLISQRENPAPRSMVSSSDCV